MSLLQTVFHINIAIFRPQHSACKLQTGKKWLQWAVNSLLLYETGVKEHCFVN